MKGNKMTNYLVRKKIKTDLIFILFIEKNEDEKVFSET
jgi:hypothetical protein